MSSGDPSGGTQYQPVPEGSRRSAQAAEDLFRSVLETARIGLWEADMATREAWRSPVHADIFGYSTQEMEPWSVDAFRRHIHPEDREWVDRLIREAVRNGTSWDLECRIVRRDNAIRWVAIRSVPTSDGQETQRCYRGIVLDVTERKVAEIAARENDRRFAHLANAAPVLIWTSGVDKLCDFFNEPWLAFTGRTMEQELGNGWAEGVHSEDFERCLRTYVTHFDARLPFRMEYRLRRHDGVYRWILDQGVPRYLQDGTFAGYVGSCIDVTEQRLDREMARQAERAAGDLYRTLEALTAEQRIILNTSPLGIALVRHRRIVWTNPAYQQLLGYSEEELRGMPTQELYQNEADYRRLGIEVYEALRRGETCTTEVRLRRKGGGSFWCQIIGKAVHPTDPEAGSIWLLKDVDESRKAEAQLQLQSEMLAHMGEGVVLVGETDGIILHSNPMFDRMLGYAAGELQGQPISVVFAPGGTSQEEVANRIFAELRKQGRWEGDIVNQRKDGTTLQCHASVSRFEHSLFGNVWMSVHTDITKAKEMERALREAQKTAAIGHLAGGMAHEFNNILASMLMNIGLAQPDNAPEGVVEALAELEKSCLHAADLIQQLLAISQRSILQLQSFEWNDFLNRRMPVLQKALGDGVRVEFLGGPQPLPAMGDRALLDKALRYLCENARDAMNGQGVVRVRLEAVEIDRDPGRNESGARPGRFACLSVTDEGCGMDLKTRGKLFEPFFTTKEVGKGKGLGLATLMGIVRQHQGWVEVESEVGRGSCFRVYLPLVEASGDAISESSTEAPAQGVKATILLAEDEISLRKVVSRVLDRAGYRVLEAPHAAAAWELWEAHGRGIDLLLSDVVMPGGESGIQLAQRLLRQRPELKVILTSGHDTAMEDQPTEVRNRMLYLAKPVPSEVLLQCIEQALDPAR